MKTLRLATILSGPVLRIVSLTTLCWLLLNTCSLAQTLVWQKTLGGANFDHAKSYAVDKNGDIVIAGITTSDNGDVRGYHGGQGDIWVVKLNQTGNLLWQKPLGGSGYESSNAITVTNDGDIVLTGISQSNDGDVSGNTTKDDNWIVRLDKAGNLRWQKLISRTNIYEFTAITATNDGGVVAIGYTWEREVDANGKPILYKLLGLKFDATGKLLWQKFLGYNNQSYTIKESPDGNLVVAGWVYYPVAGDASVSQGDSDAWLAKFDAQGNPIWQKTYSTPDREWIHAFRFTSDGGYVLTGSTSQNEAHIPNSVFNTSNYVVIKLSDSGEISWRKIFGGSNEDIAKDVIETSDGRYVIAGNSQYATYYYTDGDVSGSYGGRDIWVIQVSKTGDLLWQKTFGGNPSDEAVGITQLPNGSFMLVGNTDSNNGDVFDNKGNEDFWVANIKISSLQLNPPGYACQSGQLTFQTSGGNGSTIEFQAIGVASWTTNPVQTIEPGVRSDPNSSPLLLMARQDGQVFTRSFDFRAYCNGQNQPPVFIGPLPTQHVIVGSVFTYALPVGAFTDPEKQKLTISATGLPPGMYLSYPSSVDNAPQRIEGLPKQAGVYTVVLTATDPKGATCSGTIDIVVRATELQLTEPQYNCQTGQIFFYTKGGNGTPIDYQAVGITSWSPNPAQTIELGVRLDPNSKPLTLMARQSGTTVTRTFDFRAYCQSKARVAIKTSDKLQVRVLGNPVRDHLSVELTGAEGQSVQLRLSDLTGKIITQTQIEQCSDREYFNWPLPVYVDRVLLLHVYTLTHQHGVRVLVSP